MSDHMQQARWCLYCDSATHFSHECQSTHGINTPQAVELHRLLAERAALKQTLHDELDANLRLRDIGGARPDEPMTTFLERVFAERDDLEEKVKHAEMAASAEGNYADDLKRQCAALAARVGVLTGLLSEVLDDLPNGLPLRIQSALASPSAPVEAAPAMPPSLLTEKELLDIVDQLIRDRAYNRPAAIAIGMAVGAAVEAEVRARMRAAEAAPGAPAEPVAPDRDEAIRIWRKHCAPFSNKLGAHPPSVVVAAMMDFASAAIAAARAEGAEQMRDVLQRCVKGIDRLSELARLWEPDHSSGADRRGWVLAKDARDDAAELLRSLPVEAPNVAIEPRR